MCIWPMLTGHARWLNLPMLGASDERAGKLRCRILRQCCSMWHVWKAGQTLQIVRWRSRVGACALCRGGLYLIVGGLCRVDVL